MMIQLMDEFSYEYWERPGRYWTKAEIDHHINEMRAVASTCFNEVPNYQALSKHREELRRCIIIVARNKSGKMIGFCSSIEIIVPQIGRVLHTGLTCVDPSVRSKGLTHKLSSRVMMNYLLRNSAMSNLWVSNVACVVSSLGNVGLHMENVYPSPKYKHSPSQDHVAIADYIVKHYRSSIHISSKATFDSEKFVIKGSNEQGNPFFKSAEDRHFHHRNPEITNFYLNQMDMSNGDEVIQIGQISLMTFPKYLVAQMVKTMKKMVTVPVRPIPQQ